MAYSHKRAYKKGYKHGMRKAHSSRGARYGKRGGIVLT